MKYKNIERGFKRIGMACSLVWVLHVSLAYMTFEPKSNFNTKIWFWNQYIGNSGEFLESWVGSLILIVVGLLFIWVPICLIVGVGFRMIIWVANGFRDEEK